MTSVAVSIQGPPPTGGYEEQLLAFVFPWALIAVIVVGLLVYAAAQWVKSKREPDTRSNPATSLTVGTAGQDHQ